MFSESEARKSIPGEEGPCNNQNPLKTEIVGEILQCQKLQEEIVLKINQSKKALHEEEKHALQRSKEIGEIGAAVIASSKVLEQETYKRWKFTRNLSSVRNMCQDVNSYSEKTENILNRCEQDLVGYEKQVMSLGGILEERKSRIDAEVEAQRRKLHELEIAKVKDKERRDSEKEDLLAKIAEVKQKIQIETEASLQLRSRLEQGEQTRTQIAVANTENTELRSKLLEKQERKQSLLASIENNRQHYNARICEMKSTFEDVQSKQQRIAEENETVAKALEEEGDRKENILSEISEYSKQLDYHKQKCLETEAEGKRGEERFTQVQGEAASKAQALTDSLSTLEGKLSEDKQIKSQLESELAAMTEEIQVGLANIELLKSEISKLQSLNEIKAAEVSEIKLSIDVTASSVVKISNDLIDLTKKVNEKETRKSQDLVRITGEIQELERRIEEVRVAGNAKLNEITEEMESYRIKASENLLKRQETDREIAKHVALKDELEKEVETVVGNTKQLENDLQGVTLEHDILLKKVEETRRSNLARQKDEKVFERPQAYRKRDLEELSDSSMEGTISVQEHMKRQKLKAHKTSTPRASRI